MADVLTREQRRHNMSRIRGRDTKPEMILRRGLHARGMRYSLQRRDLPGRPDIVFSGPRVAVFVHGCFWHGHGCQLSKLPSTRTEFWSAKIAGNVERDQRAVKALTNAGWRILIVWECATRGRGRLPENMLLDVAENFICGRSKLADDHPLEIARTLQLATARDAGVLLLEAKSC